MKNFYEILEVSKDATKDEIKKSFRNLAKKYHPDTNINDKTLSEKFQLINEAYSVLSDEKSRKEYDEKIFKTQDPLKNNREKKKGNTYSKKTGDIKDAMENLNSKFEEFFGFNGNTSEVRDDFLKKDSKNPMDTSAIFNSFFNPKKK
ncbi:dnaJ domain protein [Clostridium argentinense CDC 2741]|uniref:DnaJ domain protein n=1 Tax=Clostridium argentinense CDC 2741 TaxID=1418104 RepID=A0A0C1UEW6_9CLOT|nr:DnaJ domain-containing protein [Clostridium argentinense]ARC83423.1 molecular chaperone DnaJ [Clostridium argentinense]KIE45910.1 dnaJ domain protein [Clostridium argentinense CDC 2741]NFF39132.1 J domain-containing protein [Clostridium argentinense]NFP49544.1 J domain-containing protein [Clostridium argentinense]NFP72247.1 J domain-containing protein [Clostridium argentinense]